MLPENSSAEVAPWKGFPNLWTQVQLRAICRKGFAHVRQFACYGTQSYGVREASPRRLRGWCYSRGAVWHSAIIAGCHAARAGCAAMSANGSCKRVAIAWTKGEKTPDTKEPHMSAGRRIAKGRAKRRPYATDAEHGGDQGKQMRGL